jgi:hypothetical protein
MIHLPPSMGASLRFSLAASRASHKPTVQRILESSERYCVSLFVSTFATISAVGPTRRPLPGPSRATIFQNALIRHYADTEATVRDGFKSLQAGQTTATKSFWHSGKRSGAWQRCGKPRQVYIVYLYMTTLTPRPRYISRCEAISRRHARRSTL